MEKEKNKNYCAYTGKDCIQDTETVNCEECKEYGNGVRATGNVNSITFNAIVWILAISQILLLVAKLVGFQISLWLVLLPIMLVIFIVLLIIILYTIFIILVNKDRERLENFYD